jgi:hypothetical protein
MRAYELLTEEELKEYRLDTKEKMSLSATLPWKIAENPKYLKIWNKALKTRDLLAAATFTQDVLEPIMRQHTYSTLLISDAHDYFFHALTSHSGEREEFVQRLNAKIQEAYKSIQAKKAQEPGIFAKAKQAISKHLPKQQPQTSPEKTVDKKPNLSYA